MSKKKRFILFLAIASLFFSMNMVQKTYAKYVTTSNGEANLNIARWDIVVNDEHIKNKEELSADITPQYVENPNVAEGVIAPGSIGYFDITIDPTNTDVSFDFEISIDNEESDVTDLKLLKYYIDSEDNIKDAEENEVIFDSININDKKAKTVRIYVIWDESLNETMDNIKDSEVGHDSENKKASVNVNLKFKQTL